MPLGLAFFAGCSAPGSALYFEIAELALRLALLWTIASAYFPECQEDLLPGYPPVLTLSCC